MDERKWKRIITKELIQVTLLIVGIIFAEIVIISFFTFSWQSILSVLAINAIATSVVMEID